METVSVNGVDIAYSRFGTGKPLVLIHGFPLDSSIWREMTLLLGGAFDVISPDLRGFGGSATLLSPYSMADMADDLAGLLDGLKIEKSALAGHSMGGYVSLAFAKKYPDRVAGLGLISSQIFADAAERRKGRYQEARDIEKYGTGTIVNGMAPKLSSNMRVQEIVRDVMARQDPAGLIGALKAMAEREDFTGYLASMDLPLILVHGDADVLIPVEKAREIKSLLPSAELIELRGAGHMPMMEQPEETAQALRLLK